MPALRLTAWFAVLVFVLGTGAFFALLPPRPAGESRASVLLLWAVFYGIAGVVLLDGALRHRSPVPVPPLLVAVVSLTALSVLWSDAEALTLRRSVGLAGTVLVGTLLAQRLAPVQIFDALRRAMLLISLASLVLFATGDPRAVDLDHNTLRGVVATKNSLGAFMALGVLATSVTALLDPSRVRRCILSALPMVTALFLTDSTGATLTAALVLLGTIVAAIRPRPTGRVLLGCAAAMLLGIVTITVPQTTAEQVAGAVGEDTTLTGRDAIWELSTEAGARRPLLGYGYGAFWEGTAAAEDIRDRLQWPVPNGHNGLLDIWLDLGVAGVIAMALLLGALLVRGVRDARAGVRGSAALRLSVAALLIIRNTAESGFLQQNTLLTVLMVVALATPGAERVARGGSRTVRSRSA